MVALSAPDLAVHVVIAYPVLYSLLVQPSESQGDIRLLIKQRTVDDRIVLCKTGTEEKS